MAPIYPSSACVAALVLSTVLETGGWTCTGMHCVPPPGDPSWLVLPSHVQFFTLFFCLFILAYSLARLWRRAFYSGFPSAVRARRHVASSPLPYAQAWPKKIEYAPKKSHMKDK